MVVARKRQAQTLVHTIEASCLTTDQVGDAVYVRGPSSGGGMYQVGKVDVTSGSKMPGLGVIIAKSSPTAATVQMTGEVIGLYSGLTPGKTYFIGTTGRPVLTPPKVPGSRTYVQALGLALDSNVLALKLSSQLIVAAA